MELTWDASAVDRLAHDGYDPKYGARPLRRLIQRTVEDTMSEELLSGRISLGGTVCLTLRDDRITVVTREEPVMAETDEAGDGAEEAPVKEEKKPVKRGRPAKRRPVKKTPVPPENNETED